MTRGSYLIALNEKTNIWTYQKQTYTSLSDAQVAAQMLANSTGNKVMILFEISSSKLEHMFTLQQSTRPIEYLIA